MTSTPRAFSYVRFSSAKQTLGDSERRQYALASEYASRKGLDLSDRTFEDLGVSAFRGSNLDAGLGQFLEAVREGKVKAGDRLLVENLDRISRREPWDAFTTFQEIINAGVILVTLSPTEQEYSLAGIKKAGYLLYPVLGQMQAAHEKSKQLSERLGAVWARKKQEARETGKMTTRSVPAWLEERNGQPVANKRKAGTVRRIFDMTLEGHGKQSIAHTFNSEAVPVFGRASGWSESYVRLILNNPAVIGHYQPTRRTDDGTVPDGEVIPDYFPPVVEEEVFYRVKHRRAGVSGKGKKHPPRNALAGLLKCKQCGGTVHFLNKGSGNLYLQCDNAKRKVRTCDARKCEAPESGTGDCEAPECEARPICEAKPLPYWPTFTEIMMALDEFRAYQANNGAAKKRAEEIDTLAAEIAELEERANNILELVEGGNKRAGDRLAKLEATLEEKKAKRRDMEEMKIAREPAPADLENPLSQYIILADQGPDALDPETMGQAVRHINSEMKRQLSAVLVAKGEPVEFVAKDGTKVTPERKAEMDAILEAARQRFKLLFEDGKVRVIPRG
jgi:DNA invertase Pin-like site-specific DNA recombinase